MKALLDAVAAREIAQGDRHRVDEPAEPRRHELAERHQMHLVAAPLFGAVPVLNGCGGVSWQGHLCGAIAGVLAAYWLSKPEREARARARD